MGETGRCLRSKQEILAQFDTLRSQLDNFQDTREKLIKASRDATNLSKRLIFHLHHIMTEGSETGPGVAKIAHPKLVQIERLFADLRPDLGGDQFWRYQRAISPGLQEYIEALSFAHYLTHNSLITWSEVQNRLSDESGSPVSCLSLSRSDARLACTHFPLPIEDYLLGVSDLTGELMRYAITAIPRKGGRATASTVCAFLRQCKADFGALTHHSRELTKKQRVTVESLHKIEDVAYAVAIRCYEYDLPHDILDDIVSRTLDTSQHGEFRGKQGDCADLGYY
ncbi:Translin [Thelephora terrestris]|uniref:Translin n=1 Tax=Thelephora terrestris TaxID=56493 RepID=A0A9P6L7H1_9AGAM|nr:Translin [Thelephora terrestris]